METFTERFVEAQKQLKAISPFLLKRAGAKPPARSRSSSAQHGGIPHATSAAVRREHEPAVRSLNSPPPNGELSLMGCSPPRLLSQFTEAWQALPGVSEWVMKSIKNGYTLQFFRRPPRFNGVLMSTVRERNASVLREEIHNLLAKHAVEAVPLTDRESCFYSRYFLVPKKDGGLRPILDLRTLNCALSNRSFKMITLRQILSHIRPGDWFISVNLKDAYFHIQVAPRHRRFLRFAFEGITYQFTVLPFGLCLAPRTFTKCMDAALSPLKQSGMRILNYLDDWLVLAQSESALLSDKFRLLAHIQSLGLTVNMQKSMLIPSKNISYLGVELNSINMRVRLSEERSQKLISSLAVFKLGHFSGLPR